jgi:uncharacterized membrane protein
MIPFLIFLVATAAARLAGALLIPALDSWPAALRSGFVPTLALTASAHWGRRRHDLVRMIPPAFKNPGALVTLTGILELAGAVGLLIRPLAPWAALGLGLLFIAVFPANVRAARQQLTIGGRRATPLPLRLVIQVIFIAAAGVIFVDSIR